MNIQKIPMLSMDSPTFAEDLAKLLGVQPGDKINIVTPQFERPDGRIVEVPSFTPEDWANLPKKSEQELKDLGLGEWDETSEGTHFLFPQEWYSIIPKGLKVLSISGKEMTFIPGVTDDDYRFGCLSYGFIKPKDNYKHPFLNNETQG